MIIYCAQKTSDLFIVLLFSNQIERNNEKHFFKTVEQINDYSFGLLA